MTALEITVFVERLEKKPALQDSLVREGSVDAGAIVQESVRM